MRTVASRTQRRMERKQALLLLLMVLAVALVSFALGVMVGRGGAPQVASEEPSRHTPVRQEPASTSPASKEAAAGEARVNLTFYETLPKGEAPPLGSGINLPPHSAPQEKVDEAKPPSPQVGTGAAEAQPVVAPPALKRVTSTESYVLQVASFRSAADARALSLKLQEKGYPAQVREVDLGTKGAWSRVLVGPFTAQTQAQEVQRRLEKEERLSPMLRKE